MSQAASQAVLKLLASGAMGYVWQWVLFAPKKVPNPVAWGALLGAGFALYLWMTPSFTKDVVMDWRLALVPLVQFFLTAKGTGSTAKATGLAPPTDSL